MSACFTMIFFPQIGQGTLSADPSVYHQNLKLFITHVYSRSDSSTISSIPSSSTSKASSVVARALPEADEGEGRITTPVGEVPSVLLRFRGLSASALRSSSSFSTFLTSSKIVDLNLIQPDSSLIKGCLSERTTDLAALQVSHSSSSCALFVSLPSSAFSRHCGHSRLSRRNVLTHCPLCQLLPRLRLRSLSRECSETHQRAKRVSTWQEHRRLERLPADGARECRIEPSKSRCHRVCREVCWVWDGVHDLAEKG